MPPPTLADTKQDSRIYWKFIEQETESKESFAAYEKANLQSAETQIQDWDFVRSADDKQAERTQEAKNANALGR